MSSNEPEICINPQSALLDEKVSVVIKGLEPGTEYRVTASQKDDDGVLWISDCLFLSGDEGEVDLKSSVPVSGSYEEADQMGIFWSMEPNIPADSVKQNFANKGLDPIACDISVFSGNELLDTKAVERLRISPSVKQVTLTEDGLVGSLFLPYDNDKSIRGAVIMVSGSGGGYGVVQPAILASHGIPTLSLAYFNAEGLPNELREIPLEYFEKAIDWLGCRKEIDGENLAIVGASRGGELALLLGSRLKALTAVIAIVPNCFVCGSFGVDPENICAAWKFKGEGIPYFSSELASEFREKMGASYNESGVGGFVDLVMREPALKEVIIPVEETNGPVLLLSGENDCIWASKFYGDVAFEILKRQKHPYVHDHCHYEGCGHFWPLGYLPTTVMSVLHPVGGKLVEFGGEAKTVSLAGVDAWKRSIVFLKQSLA